MEWLERVGTREMVRVACPHCECVLNTPDDETKIKVHVKSDKEEGTLLLSAFWGDYRSFEEGWEIVPGEVATMFCPHCGTSLQGEQKCEECSATISVFRFSSGAIAICNRKGCKMHLRRSSGRISLNTMLTLSLSAWGGPYGRL